MTKRIKVITAVSATLIAVGCILYYFANQIYITSEVDTGNYIDRNSITEPVLQIGRYYLNGNDDKCFFEVMPNNIIALNGSDEDIFELHKTKYPNYDTVITNEEKSEEELLKNDIEFWNTPHEYFVRTEIYSNETITIVAVKWTTDMHGNYSSLSGLGYIDSQTLRYCGFDFILSEKN